MVVDPSGPLCSCGRRGCWERYASGSGLARLAREAATAGRLGAVMALARGDAESVRGEHVTEAAAAGDPGALEVMEELGWWIALGVANLTALARPFRGRDRRRTRGSRGASARTHASRVCGDSLRQETKGLWCGSFLRRSASSPGQSVRRSSRASRDPQWCDRPVRIGVTLPSFREDASAVDAAILAERLGLDGVFVFDHLWPIGQPDRPALSAMPLARCSRRGNRTGNSRLSRCAHRLVARCRSRRLAQRHSTGSRVGGSLRDSVWATS